MLLNYKKLCVMKYKLEAFGILQDGQRKDSAGNPHQEDCIFPAKDKIGDGDRLFIVCDGMGGHDAGEVASATVCEAMTKAIAEKAEDAEGVFTDEILQYAIEQAYIALDERDTGSVKKMGTTMTILKLHSRGATIAHIGDSRVYHIRPGVDAESTKIMHVTKDHSLLNDLLDIGELTEDEIPDFKQKNVITRAMQPNTERRCRADIYHTTDILPGDYFYLCTDGMLENTIDENIRFIFSDKIENKEDALIQTTFENRDNHSAIVVHILDVEGTIDDEKKDDSKKMVMAIVDDNDGPKQENDEPDSESTEALDEEQKSDNKELTNDEKDKNDDKKEEKVTVSSKKPIESAHHVVDLLLKYWCWILAAVFALVAIIIIIKIII